jgi:hypothetical protein
MSGHGAINSIEVSRIPLPGRARCARNFKFFDFVRGGQFFKMSKDSLYDYL